MKFGHIDLPRSSMQESDGSHNGHVPARSSVTEPHAFGFPVRGHEAGRDAGRS